MFLKSLKDAMSALFQKSNSSEIVEREEEPMVVKDTYLPLFHVFSDILPDSPYTYQEIHEAWEQRLIAVESEVIIPDYVADYLCRDAIVLSILRIFRETKGWNCKTLEELKPLVGENPPESSEIYSTIRMCDPYCSTGQFLQAALNQLIEIKAELGIWVDDAEQIVNPFHSDNPANERLILLEKQKFIKNSLFGADIRPEHVALCRMRLLLEQLKHIDVLCKKGGEWSSPVDCNVIYGDSLYYHIPIDSNDLRSTFRKLGASITHYKEAAEQFKSTDSPDEKRQLGLFLEELRHSLYKELSGCEKNTEEIAKLQREIVSLNAPTLFEPSPEEKTVLEKRISEVEAQLELCKKKQDELLAARTGLSAVEWRIDFPELWDEEGVFWGFDVMLGYLPDTSMTNMEDRYSYYEDMKYATLSKKGYLSSLYYELASRLLKPEYYLSYLSTNKWMEQVVVSKLSKVFKTPMSPQRIIRFPIRFFGKKQQAVHSIWLIKKTPELTDILACDIGSNCEKTIKGLTRYVEINAFPYSPISQVVEDVTVKDKDGLSKKLKLAGKPLGEWDLKFFDGITTGADEAFIVSEEERDLFISEGYKYGDIMKPIVYGRDISPYSYKLSGSYLLYLPWHFPLHYDVTIVTASEKAESRFNQQYPAVYRHLLKHASVLRARSSQVGNAYEWYALSYHGEHPWDDYYAEQKIACAKQAVHPSFCLDYSGCALLQDCTFIIGQHLKYILAVLNSKVGSYLLHELLPDELGVREVTADFLSSFVMPVPDVRVESEIGSLINRLTGYSSGVEREIYEQRLNQLIYDVYALEASEVATIEAFYAQLSVKDS